MLITNHGRIITALYMEQEVTSVAYQRVLEVLLIVAGGQIYTYGVADTELEKAPPQLLSKTGEDNQNWCTVGAFSLEESGLLQTIFTFSIRFAYLF